MTDAATHLETLKRLSLPASRRVPVDTAEYQRALAYAIRAIEERDELIAALRADYYALNQALREREGATTCAEETEDERYRLGVAMAESGESTPSEGWAARGYQWFAANLDRQRLKERIQQLAEERNDARRLYQDLLCQVEKKHPNETRHETAKRYLRQHENHCGQGGPVDARLSPSSTPEEPRS